MNDHKDNVSRNRKTALDAEKDPDVKNRPNEKGGRDASKGKDPTRFGDWEKDGKCVDF